MLNEIDMNTPSMKDCRKKEGKKIKRLENGKIYSGICKKTKSLNIFFVFGQETIIVTGEDLVQLILDDIDAVNENYHGFERIHRDKLEINIKILK